MAELIPIGYRLAVMRRRQIRRWVGAGALAALLAGGSLAFTYGWRNEQATELKRISDEFNAKSILLARADAMTARRLDLASRMQTLEQLAGDKVLLQLLRNVFSGFSDSDSLEYINIKAHDAGVLAGTSGAVSQRYSVRIAGITANDTTYADLLSRLTRAGAASNPPLVITPESLRRAAYMDGQVMRFQILCDQPAASKGG